MGNLSGKIALVTGAGQGVGQGIAWALSAEGASVAVAGRTLSKLEATCAEIARRGGTAFAVECDVKRLDSLERCVARVVERFGRINILVNNAQEVPLGPLNGVTEAALQAGWESGPLATFRLMKLCYPHLKGDGCIINLASTAASLGRQQLQRLCRRQGSDPRAEPRRGLRVGQRRDPHQRHPAARQVPGAQGLDRESPRGGRRLHRDYPAAAHRRM